MTWSPYVLLAIDGGVVLVRQHSVSRTRIFYHDHKTTHSIGTARPDPLKLALNRGFQKIQIKGEGFIWDLVLNLQFIFFQHQPAPLKLIWLFSEEYTEGVFFPSTHYFPRENCKANFRTQKNLMFSHQQSRVRPPTPTLMWLQSPMYTLLTRSSYHQHSFLSPSIVLFLNFSLPNLKASELRGKKEGHCKRITPIEN